MEKLDKEALLKNYINAQCFEDSNGHGMKELKTAYKDALHIAENHYLKVIEEKEQLLNQYREDYIRLCKEKATIGII